ncbi:MAG: hypothetical protein LBS96_05370 [Oscillospiraceae bacterium]|jgi:hypothetical protein|nr:hypothetical protein [Oscillospiraceae bacterium]
MKVFRRTIFSMIKGLAVAVFGAAAAAVILYAVTVNAALAGLVGVALLAVLLFIVIFSENIRVEVEDGQLRYFQRGKLKTDLRLAEYAVRYVIRSSQGSTDAMNVYFTPLAGGDEIVIDFDPLGRKQFDALWALLEENCAGQEPTKIETKK